MQRALVLAALLAPQLAAAAPSVVPVPTAVPVPNVLPNLVIDRLVRVELGVRDLFQSATDELATLAAKSPAKIPDLTILTTEPIPETLSSGFGWREDPIRHDRRFHGGTDFKADPGTPVLAAGDGVVVFAGRQGGYGNVIYVDHGGGVVTRYGHLRRIETKKDAPVRAGERIGQVGQTGRATGPHLHFEVRLDGRAVDPITAMTVAELERTSPATGQLAAYALAPELQAKVRAGNDHHPAAESRPERAGRGKHTQVLW